MPETQMASRTSQRSPCIRSLSPNVSSGNRAYGFAPGFLDTGTGAVYVSCDAHGHRAPSHRLDGLPNDLVVARNLSGGVAHVKRSIVSRFRREGRSHFSRGSRSTGQRHTPLVVTKRCSGRIATTLVRIATCLLEQIAPWRHFLTGVAIGSAICFAIGFVVANS